MHTHPDRVIFGTDCFPPTRDDYELHYRFLETDDEHFAYWTGANLVGPQGRWHISGTALSAPALRAVYATNAQQFLRVGG